MKNKSKKFLMKILLVFFLLIIYSYILAITNLPDNLVVFEGETISMKTLLGLNIKINDETIETLSNNSQSITKQAGKATLEVSLFDNINIKNVDVDVLPKTKVIPVRKYSRSKIIY